MRLVRTERYLADARRVFAADEQAAAERDIMATPLLWPIVPKSGGVRKARARRGSAGKSGGARVIYYYASAAGALFLLHVYAKNRKEDLSPDDLKQLRRIVERLKEALNG